MRDLLPETVAVAVARPVDWTGPLLAAESACLGPQVGPARRREFAAGRACARRALARLDVRGVAVPAGADRIPIWPARTLGSITHTHGFCAAAVAWRADVRAVGIDAERIAGVHPGLWDRVCRPAELAWSRGRTDGVCWPLVVFSAKETVYKVWSPLVGTWLGFHDVEVDLDPPTGTFVARVAAARVEQAAVGTPRPPSAIPGRFAVGGGLVRTAAVLPA